MASRQESGPPLSLFSFTEILWKASSLNFGSSLIGPKRKHAHQLSLLYPFQLLFVLRQDWCPGYSFPEHLLFQVSSELVHHIRHTAISLSLAPFLKPGTFRLKASLLCTPLPVWPQLLLHLSPMSLCLLPTVCLHCCHPVLFLPSQQLLCHSPTPPPPPYTVSLNLFVAIMGPIKNTRLPLSGRCGSPHGLALVYQLRTEVPSPT